MPVQPHQPDHHDALNKLWARQSRWDMIERAVGTVEAIVVPVGIHAISCSVVGGPGADLRRCWYLCLAAAFGRYNRSPVKSLFGFNIKAVWDVTGKACGVTIVYATNVDGGASSLAKASKQAAVIAAGGIAAQAGLVADGFTNLLQRGPDQFTIGGKWPNQLLTVSQRLQPPTRDPGTTPHPSWTVGDPSTGGSRFRGFTLPPQTTQLDREVLGGADDPNVAQPILPFGRIRPGPYDSANDQTNLLNTDPPQLPDYQRIITTGSKLDPRVQPPKPPADGISRGSLVQLVTAALGQSGTWPRRPIGNEPVLGSSGVFSGEAGPGVSNDALIDPVTEGPDGLTLPTNDLDRLEL